MDTSMLAKQSEFALAAYASLQSGVPNEVALQDHGNGMSARQAQEFKSRYTVLTQYNDTAAEGGMGTSFSATVFKDASGNLTLAIRGTAELKGTPNDLTTDSSIFTSGAGYDQIVAMYNWWLRVSTPEGDSVLQYQIVPGPLDPHDGFQFGMQWLKIMRPVAASGELVAAISADPDSKLDVTGHSLGGHLAMAFGALFPDTTSQVTAFNAPGFTDTTSNLSFFSALGGTIPSGVATTNVIADEANIGTVPWSAIAGLNSRPGVAVDIPIENQWQSDERNPPSAKNHSQQTLSDALAVYALLAKLDPAVTTTTFKSVLAAAALGTSASLENILDALQSVFGVSNNKLPVGNANRDALYQAIYAIRGSSAYQTLAGNAIVSPTSADIATAASDPSNSDGIAYRYALKELNPFTITGDNSLYAKFDAHGELDLVNTATASGTLTADWLQARAKMLNDVLAANTADTGQNKALRVDTSSTDLHYYEDMTSGITVQEVNQVTGAGDDKRTLFGAAGKTLLGGKLDDGLFAGDGNETLVGGAGNDTLQAGLGEDILKGGDGTDKFQLALLTRMTNATDTIDDTDGKGSVWIGDALLRGLGDTQGSGTRNADGSITWTVDKVQYLFSGANPNAIGTMTITGGVLAKNNDSIVIKNFDLNQAQTSAGYLGIQLGQAQLKVEAGTQHKSIMDVLSDKGAEVVNWAKGELEMVTLYVSQVLDHPQKLLVDLTAAAKSLGSWLGINTGATLDSLANGPVELTIDAGQDSVTVALVKTAEITGTQTIGLTATLENPDGTTPANAASDTLTFNYQGPASVTTTPDRTIIGDLQPIGGIDDLRNLLVDPNTPAPGLDDNLYDSSGNDLINAGDGNNTIAALHGGNDTITAGAGNDSIYTGAGNDVISGGGGADLLLAGHGNNQIYATAKVDIGAAIDQGAHGTASGLKGSFLAAGDGNNTIVGGLGNDAIFVGGGDNLIILGPGNDSVVAGVDVGNASSDWYTDVVNGTLTFENVNAASSPYAVPASFQGTTYNGVPVGAGNDTIFGGRGNDLILGANGSNYIDAGGGNDTIYGGNGDDTIFGGSGNTLIYGNGGNDYIDGESGNSTLVGGNGNNTIFGGSGNDVIYAGNDGADWATSASGKNYVDAGSGNSLIYGSGGNDTLIGGSGKDTIYGGDGTEYIEAGSGNTLMYGGNGTDTIVGGDGNDTIYAGDGSVTVYGGQGTDLIYGGAGTDVLYAGDGGSADNPTRVIAGTGQTTIYGGAGTAVLDATASSGAYLVAGAGSDTLLGGGNDTLVAGQGDVLMVGSSQNNTYEIGAGSGAVEIGRQGSGDTLMFGAGISPDNLTISAGYGRDGQAATVIDYGGENTVTLDGGLDGNIGRFVFADGGTLTLEQLLARAALGGVQQMDPSAAMAAYLAKSQVTETQQLQNEGYVAQADGSWYEAPRLSGGQGAAYTRSSTITSWGSAASGTTKTSESDSWYLGDSYAYAYSPYYSNSIQISDSSVTLQQGAVDATDAVIVATDQSNSNTARVGLPVTWTVASTPYSTGVYSYSINGYIYADGSFGTTWVSGATQGTLYSQTNYSKYGASATPVLTNGTYALQADPGVSHTASGTGPLPSVLSVEAYHSRFSVNLQQINVGAGSHVVNGGSYNVINAGSDDNTVNGGGFVYTGSGNDIVSSADVVYAGSGNNTISYAHTVYAGSGSDTIYHAQDVYGGSGDAVINGADHVFGGSGNDTISSSWKVYAGSGDDLILADWNTNFVVAGSGNDTILNQDGAFDIVINPATVGHDVIGGIADQGYQLLNAFYHSHGIDDWEERYTNPNGRSYSGSLIQPLPFIAIVNGSRWQPAGYYSAMNVPVVQTFSVDDFATLAPYYQQGLVWPDEKVIFGPGVTPSDLTLSRSHKTLAMSGSATDPQVAYKTFVIKWGTDQSVEVILPNATDPVGSGVQEFDFSDGSKLTMADLIALAPPEWAVFRTGMGRQTSTTDVTSIHFAADVNPADLTVSRDGTDLLIGDKGGADVLRVTNWYANPAAMPTLPALFSDGSTWSADTLTSKGLVVDGSSGNRTLVGLAGFANVLIAGANDTLVAAGKDDTVQFGADVTADSIRLSESGTNLVVIYGSQQDTITLKDFFITGPTDGKLNLGFADGTSGTLEALANGDSRVSWSLYSGYVATADYDQSGRKIADSVTTSDSWSTAAQASQYYADGSKTMTYSYTSGSYSSQQYQVTQADGSFQVEWSDSSGYVGHGSRTMTDGLGSYVQVYSGNDGYSDTETYNGVDGTDHGIHHNSDGSYYTYSDSANGDYYETDFDASGAKTYDYYRRSSDGFWSEDYFSADGTSYGYGHNSDGSHSEYTNDGQGTVTTKYYDASYQLLSSSVLFDDGHGKVTTLNYDAVGSLLGSKVALNDGLGNLTTTDYDAGGNKLDDIWSHADGSHGSGTFNADGSSSGTAVNPDGGTSSYTDDGHGNRTTENYSAQGLLAGDTWAHSDGSHGNTIINADGSSSGATTNADGSGSSYTDDGHGDRVTQLFNTSGVLISDAWTRADGSHGSDTFNADGSRDSVVTGSDGLVNTTHRVFGSDGSSQDSWTKSDGTSGSDSFYPDGTIATSQSSDGTTLNRTLNSDGSSTTSTYTAATGVYGYDAKNADGSYTDYQTIYDAGGGYQQAWTASDGSSGENDKSADGSTLTSRTNVDGSSTISTYDASTGIYGYDAKNADGSYTDYQTTYDAGGGYQQAWTASDGSSGENDKSTDGSTLIARTNADGSGTTSTYDASTGIYGYDAKNADGSFTDYQTTYDTVGGYQQHWTANDGSSGENDKSVDGSTLTLRNNADGSSTTSTFDAATGVYGYDQINADGSSVDYQTTYDGSGGYQQSWTASDGSSGENDKSADGSTLTSSTNVEGSGTISTYTASTGIYGYKSRNADGSQTDYQTTYDGSGGYKQSWTASDGSSGENDRSADGSTLTSSTNVEGSGTISTFNASTGVYGYEARNADGSKTDYQTTYDGSGGYQQAWTASDGSSGENDKSADGSTLTSRTNADGSSTVSTVDATTGVNGYTSTDAAGNSIHYDTTYDGSGGYLQHWAASDGSSGENDKSPDGSTLTARTNADGGGTTSTYDASTGVNGYDARNADGSFIDYQTTYDTAGGYLQHWTASDGSSGENDKSADGSTLTRRTNVDGSGTTSTFNAGTGVYGYDARNADGSFTDYQTTYDTSGGYFQHWTASDGSSGENDKSADGSTLTARTNIDGSADSVAVAADGTVLGSSWATTDGRQGVDADGNHLLVGGVGSDTLAGGNGNTLLIGGNGDLLVTGSGTDVIAFNQGDGRETLQATAGQNNALSLGGHFAYADLAFEKNGNDLILDVGSADSIAFKDWYVSPDDQKMVTLQVVAEATANYAPGSTDVLNGNKIETFDFQALVNSFDQARTNTPGLNAWSLTHSLLDAHLTGSDSAALGGDLAYQYGMSGNLSGVGIVAAEGTLSNTQFAVAPQLLKPVATGNASAVHLT